MWLKIMSLVGVDIERISRIKKVIQKTPGFVTKVFTPLEQDYCKSHSRPEQHYTSRVCAKEALCKALGVPVACCENMIGVVYRLTGQVNTKRV